MKNELFLRGTVLTVFLITITNKKMSHSYNKIMIHTVWATKERLPLILPNIENLVYGFIRKEFETIGCPVRIINGMPDHVHCLFSLNPNKSIAETIKQIKGSTSHSINENKLIAEKFSWQTGYAAYSVSDSVVPKVFDYIKNQKKHHAKKSYQQEYDEIIQMIERF